MSTPTISPTSTKKNSKRHSDARAKRRRVCGPIRQPADAPATQKSPMHHELCVRSEQRGGTLCPVYLQLCLSGERLPYRDSYSEPWYCSGFSFLCPNLSRRSIASLR